MPTPQSQPNSLVVSVGVQCNVGKERTENQDRVTRASTPFGDLFVVADGVGGHQGGAEAAQAVVDGFARHLNAFGNLSLQEALQNAIRAISSDLQQRSATNLSLRGMGSTVVLCVVRGAHATYAHAGDSRAYLVRGGKLSQLTRDHSVMERMVSQGILSPAQAKDHPDASVLTRAIGQSADVTLDIADIGLQANDAMLLCSDGLWGYAKHKEMEAIATSASLSATAVADALLKLALEGGGGDNISIQFLRFQASKSAKSAKYLLGMQQQKALPIIALTAVLSVGASWLYVSNHTLDEPNPDFTVAQAEHPLPASNGKPAEHKDKLPTTASSQKPEATPVKPTETKPQMQVVILQGEKQSVAKWADKLNSVQGVSTVRRSAGDECFDLQQDVDILYHSEKAASSAAQIGSKVGIPASEIQLASAEDLKRCGGGEMLAMPAATPSQLERLRNKAKGGIDKAKEGIESSIGAAAKKAGEEVKKGKDKIHP
jgi:serine/threonine protein phosphatase PrpC